ncbi:hypothetical protein OROGR_018725 [Orobanche gracilis]
MPRYEDSHGTRLYVGHLSSRTRSRDLEHIFSRYGSEFCSKLLPDLVSMMGRLHLPDMVVNVRDVDMKRDYAFIDFSDPRDADDARYKLDGKDVDGRHITVEFARGVPRGHGGTRDREYGSSRGPVPGSGWCFNCGIEGHWAQDCKAGDWKNKCYRCGERGHVERDCKGSPKKLRRERSYSRSPARSYSPHRGRSKGRSFSPNRSFSRSRSPAARRGRDVENDERRSMSPENRSSKLQRRTSSPSNMRDHSPKPENGAESEKGYIDDIQKETSRSPSVGGGMKRTDENSKGHSGGSESPSRVVDENDIRSSESS